MHKPNPVAWNLGGGNYSFTTWSNLAAALTYPPNMYFHVCGVANPTLSDPTTGDYTAGYNSIIPPAFHGDNAQGVSFITNNSVTPSVGAAVLGLITTGRTNIVVSWQSLTWSTGSTYALRLQYKTTIAGTWQDVAGSRGISLQRFCR